VRRVTSPARRILMSGSSPQSAPGTPARPTDNTNFVETRDFTRSATLSRLSRVGQSVIRRVSGPGPSAAQPLPKKTARRAATTTPRRAPSSDPVAAAIPPRQVGRRTHPSATGRTAQDRSRQHRKARTRPHTSDDPHLEAHCRSTSPACRSPTHYYILCCVFTK